MRSASNGGKPFCFTKSYIPDRLAWLAAELAHCVGAFYAHLEKRGNEPIINAHQQISAVRMPREAAQALAPLAEDLSLLMLRRYVSAKGTVIASYNRHIASEFSYGMEIESDSR